MNDARQDLIHIQELVGTAFSATGSLVALTDGGQMNPNKLQKTLEQTMDYFERSTLELRQLCERYAPGVGGFMHKPMRAEWRSSATAGFTLCSIRSCRTAGIRHRAG